MSTIYDQPTQKRVAAKRDREGDNSSMGKEDDTEVPYTKAPTKDFDYILDKHVGGGGWWQWKRQVSFLGIMLLSFTSHSPCDYKKYSIRN